MTLSCLHYDSKVYRILTCIPSMDIEKVEAMKPIKQIQIS